MTLDMLNKMFENAAKRDLEGDSYFDRKEENCLYLDTQLSTYYIENATPLNDTRPNMSYTKELTKELSFAHNGFEIFVQAKVEKQSWVQILLCSGDKVVSCSVQFVVPPSRPIYSPPLNFPEESDTHILTMSHVFKEKNTPFQIRLGSSEPTRVEICELEIYKTLSHLHFPQFLRFLRGEL